MRVQILHRQFCKLGEIWQVQGSVGRSPKIHPGIKNKKKRTGLEGVRGEPYGANSLVVDEPLVEAVAAKEGVGVRAATAPQKSPLSN